MTSNRSALPLSDHNTVRIIIYILSNQWYHWLGAFALKRTNSSTCRHWIDICGFKYNWCHSHTHPSNAIAFHSSLFDMNVSAHSRANMALSTSSSLSRKEWRRCQPQYHPFSAIDVIIDNFDPVVTCQRHWIVATSIFNPLHRTDLVVFFFSPFFFRLRVGSFNNHYPFRTRHFTKPSTHSRSQIEWVRERWRACGAHLQFTMPIDRRTEPVVDKRRQRVKQTQTPKFL